MKVTVVENNHGLFISIIPESIAESNQLLRFTNNARQEKPDISMYFSGQEQECSILMRKVKEQSQSYRIKPKGRRS